MKSGHLRKRRNHKESGLSAERGASLPRRRDWALALLAFAAYLPALRAGFIWDDITAIVQNPVVLAPEGLLHLWLNPAANAGESHYWPLAYSTFWLEHRIWGLRPFGFHLTNIAMHCLNTVLVFRVLSRLRVSVAWFASALFAVHPVHVESVAWVIERKDVLSAALYLLSGLCFFRFADAPLPRSQRTWSGYAASLLLFVAAMLAKSIAVSLPAALLLCLWWRRGAEGVRAGIWWLAPFLLLGVSISAWDVWLVRQLETLGFGFTVLERVQIAGRAFWFYLWKIVWPAKLMAFYPRWRVEQRELLPYMWPAAALALTGLLFAARKRFGRAPLTAALYYQVTLLPVLGVVTFGFMMYAFVADRYVYLASVAPIAFFAAAIHIGLPPPVRTVGKALLLALLFMLTWRETLHYRDSGTFWRYNIARNPKAWEAQHQLGLVLGQAGDMTDAIAAFRVSLAVKPDYAQAHNNLALALQASGHMEEANREFAEAVRLIPNYAEAYNNWGELLSQMGRKSDALARFRKAIELRPDMSEAQENLRRLGAI